MRGKLKPGQLREMLSGLTQKKNEPSVQPKEKAIEVKTSGNDSSNTVLDPR